MKTIEELNQLSEHELVSEVLKLQVKLSKLKVDEKSASAIHNYHFISNELLKLTKDHYMGSAVIVGGIYSLSGKILVEPFSISDGLSKATINGLLDDIQSTYDQKIEFKPTKKRL